MSAATTVLCFIVNLMKGTSDTRVHVGRLRGGMTPHAAASQCIRSRIVNDKLWQVYVPGLKRINLQHAGQDAVLQKLTNLTMDYIIDIHRTAEAALAKQKYIPLTQQECDVAARNIAHAVVHGARSARTQHVDVPQVRARQRKFDKAFYKLMDDICAINGARAIRRRPAVAPHKGFIGALALGELPCLERIYPDKDLGRIIVSAINAEMARSASTTIVREATSLHAHCMHKFKFTHTRAQNVTLECTPPTGRALRGAECETLCCNVKADGAVAIPQEHIAAPYVWREPSSVPSSSETVSISISAINGGEASISASCGPYDRPSSNLKTTCIKEGDGLLCVKGRNPVIHVGNPFGGR